jgi:hypothetical protein
VLHRVGLPELVAGSVEELVSTAVNVATNSTLRHLLKKRLVASRRVIEWRTEADMQHPGTLYLGEQLRNYSVLAVKTLPPTLLQSTMQHVRQSSPSSSCVCTRVRKVT